jgi:hypothetical protein
MDEEKPDFKIYFNKKRQWIDIYLKDVHPKTFASRGGGHWGFFIAKWENPKLGFFGEVHLVKARVRPDLVVHELDHVRTDWMLSNGFTIIRQNEEKMASFLDSLVGNFYREYNKLK